MKKVIIISEEQLKEIIGYDAPNDEIKMNGSNETFVSDFIGDTGEEDFGGNLTTDKFGKTTNNNNGFLRYAARMIFREDKKKISEESEHGNKELNSKKFGVNSEFDGATYNSSNVKAHRLKTAKKKLNSGTPEEKAKAANTIQNMYKNSSQNGENLDVTITNVTNAKKAVKDNDQVNTQANIQAINKKDKNNNNIIINYF